ncbi:sulfatase family protein [Alteromonas aestuariivivens]|nr:sulfatase [Alteromonas aestuariivivens]
MTRYFLLPLLAMCLSGCSKVGQPVSSVPHANQGQQAQVQKTNVIIIVADQMRREALGYWSEEGNEGLLNGKGDYVVTPNLDELAQEGVVFTDAIANYPLCSPFRGMLLSGLFPHKNGVTNNTRTGRREVGLKLDITTLTESLAEAGYNTALIGKGHWKANLPLFNEQGHYVGSEDAPGGHYINGTRYDTYIPPGPHRNGIEYWYQALGHNHKSPMVYTSDVELSGVPEGQPYFPRVYSAVDQANVLIDYLENNRSQREADKPFGVLWAMDPPHTPYQSMDDTDEALFNAYYKDVALEALLNRDNADLEKGKDVARYYFSMVTLIDREIGRVRAALEQQGLADNTLIVFTSDHGEMMASHSMMTKNVVYEESLGIPLIFHYPQSIAHRVSDLLIGVPDFMPTILGVLGLEHYIPEGLDGKNYAGYLFGGSSNTDELPLSSFYYGKSGEVGVRTHTYTYAIDANGDIIALFNNKTDPYQMNLLQPQQLPEADWRMLKHQLGQWLTDIEHPMYADKRYPHRIAYP